jgi:hypothetical protein
MSHFALVKNGIVQDVIVAEQDFIDANPPEDGVWVQGSYNTRGGVHYVPNTHDPSADQSKAFRKNYPGIGYTYDEVRDAFYAPQPFSSWILNEKTCYWEAPIPMPPNENPDAIYTWDEANQEWVLLVLTGSENV